MARTTLLVFAFLSSSSLSYKQMTCKTFSLKKTETHSSSSCKFAAFFKPPTSSGSSLSLFFLFVFPLFSLATSIPSRAFLNLLNSIKSARLRSKLSQAQITAQGTHGNVASSSVVSTVSASPLSIENSRGRGCGRDRFLIAGIDIVAELMNDSDDCDGVTPCPLSFTASQINNPRYGIKGLLNVIDVCCSEFI